MAYTYPNVSDFKLQFARDFPYTSDIATGVTDADIQNALNLAMITFNGCIWPSQLIFSTAFLYLAANYLVLNLRAAGLGISGSFNWIETSKSVQGVSQSFAVPKSIQDNPFFALLTRTTYGATYFAMMYPYLAGSGMGVVAGTTQLDGNPFGYPSPYGYGVTGCGGGSDNGGF